MKMYLIGELQKFDIYSSLKQALSFSLGSLLWDIILHQVYKYVQCLGLTCLSLQYH